MTAQKRIIILFIFMLSFANAAIAQSKLNFGISAGISNAGYSHSYSTVPNVQVASESRKLILNPVVGAYVRYSRNRFFLQTGLEGNRIKVNFSNKYTSRFNLSKGDSSLYSSKWTTKQRTLKLGIPLIIGTQLTKNKKVNPFVFVGGNLNLFLESTLKSTYENDIDGYINEPTQYSTLTNSLTPSSKVFGQFVSGVGIRFKKRYSLQYKLQVGEGQSALDRSYWDNRAQIVYNRSLFYNKEHVLTFNVDL